MVLLDTIGPEKPSRDPAGDQLVDSLRTDILAGRYARDSRLVEEAVARDRGLSRTPVRHALRSLEQEGLLSRLPRRGYRVRSFTIDEVADAIEVRGELEAVAARLLAERGWPPRLRQTLTEIAARGGALLERSRLSEESQLEWAALNLAFHDALVHATANVGLETAYESVKRIPLVSPRAILFAREDDARSRGQIAAAQADHHRLILAIDERKGQRAAEIARDHAIRSGDTKRQNFDAVVEKRWMIADLGAALIVA